MDCCRTATQTWRRTGKSSCTQSVRRNRKAPLGKRKDAMHEDIPIMDCHVPKSFVVENGKLKGMTFEKVHAVRRCTRQARIWYLSGGPDYFY